MKKCLTLSSLTISSFVTKQSAGLLGGRAAEPTTDVNDSSCIQDYCTFDCEGLIDVN